MCFSVRQPGLANLFKGCSPGASPPGPLYTQAYDEASGLVIILTLQVPFGLLQILPLPLFEPPIAGVAVPPDIVSSLSQVVLSIPLTSRWRTSVAVRMLFDGIQRFPLPVRYTCAGKMPALQYFHDLLCTSFARNLL